MVFFWCLIFMLSVSVLPGKPWPKHSCHEFLCSYTAMSLHPGSSQRMVQTHLHEGGVLWMPHRWVSIHNSCQLTRRYKTRGGIRIEKLWIKTVFHHITEERERESWKKLSVFEYFWRTSWSLKMWPKQPNTFCFSSSLVLAFIKLYVNALHN